MGVLPRVLNVAQSAISEQIKDLEEELGVPLFNRSKRLIKLTYHGEIFLNDAKLILAAVDNAVSNMRKSLSGEIGTLTIGFFVGGTGPGFSMIIREFRKRFPGVQLSLAEMAPAVQHRALVAGSIDIGFTRPVQPADTAFVRSEHYQTEGLFAILHKSHRLAKRRTLSIRELTNEPFVMNDRKYSSSVFDKIISLCANAGFSPRIESVGTVSTGVLALVEAGAGVAILPQGSRILGNKELVFIPLSDRDATIDLVTAWSIERENPVVLAFLNLIRKRQKRRVSVTEIVAS